MADQKSAQFPTGSEEPLEFATKLIQFIKAHELELIDAAELLRELEVLVERIRQASQMGRTGLSDRLEAEQEIADIRDRKFKIKPDLKSLRVDIPTGFPH
jgi:hypothetical protein